MATCADCNDDSCSNFGNENGKIDNACFEPKAETTETAPHGVGVERLVIYAVYSDKGPQGMCGQSCSITNPWRQLHIFHDHQKFRDWVRSIEDMTFRRDPKIDFYWVKDDFCTDIVEHI